MTNTVITLDQTFSDLIQTTVAAAERGAAFVATEAPIVVEQLLKWHFVESLSMWLCGLLMIALIPLSMTKTIKWFRKYDAEPNGFTIGGLFATITLCVAGTVFMTEGGLEWLKILIAPKLYLLEYAADLIK